MQMPTKPVHVTDLQVRLLTLTASKLVMGGDDQDVARFARMLVRDLLSINQPLPDLLVKGLKATTAPTSFAPRMPKTVLGKGSCRGWAAYLLATNAARNDRERGFLKSMVRIRNPSLDQQRWLWDVLYRVEPSACGDWGAPERDGK